MPYHRRTWISSPSPVQVRGKTESLARSIPSSCTRQRQGFQPYLGELPRKVVDGQLGNHNHQSMKDADMRESTIRTAELIIPATLKTAKQILHPGAGTIVSMNLSVAGTSQTQQRCDVQPGL